MPFSVLLGSLEHVNATTRERMQELARTFGEEQRIHLSTRMPEDVAYAA